MLRRGDSRSTNQRDADEETKPFGGEVTTCAGAVTLSEVFSFVWRVTDEGAEFRLWKRRRYGDRSSVVVMMEEEEVEVGAR